jgi:hypothetical protein
MKQLRTVLILGLICGILFFAWDTSKTMTANTIQLWKDSASFYKDRADSLTLLSDSLLHQADVEAVSRKPFEDRLPQEDQRLKDEMENFPRGDDDSSRRAAKSAVLWRNKH